MFEIITAIDQNNGIGKNNSIPWNLPKDLKHFKDITENSFVIMGRNTWNSLPKKPLPNRINIIISSTIKLDVEISWDTGAEDMLPAVPSCAVCCGLCASLHCNC